jgi:hypothetical protein
MQSSETKFSNNPLAFQWTLSVLLYWQTYSYIHMWQTFSRNCYGIIKQKLTVSFNHTFRYIDRVLSINNNDFHQYVHLIYPNELEVKDTTESDKSVSYLDILLNADSIGRLKTSQYDKQDYLDFVTVNFPFLCSNIPLSPCHGVYIS